MTLAEVEKVDRPRAWIYRGSYRAAGVVLDLRLLEEEEARRRVLALWEPGLRVYRLDGALAVIFSSPRRLSSHEAPGALLLAQGPLAFSSAPAEISRQATGFLRVVGGRALQEPLNESQREDPSSWLGVEDYGWLQVADLAPPPPTAESILEKPSDDLRNRLHVDPAAPEMSTIVDALRRGRRGSPSMALLSFVASVMSFFRGRKKKEERDGMQVHGGRSGLGAFTSSVNSLFGRVALWSGLGFHLGWRQARYLEDLLDRFRQRDYGEALRRAIPTGRGGGQPAPFAWLPKRLGNLALTGPSSGGGAFMLPIFAYQQLVDAYRRAAEELERAGRIDEAVFVLAELLGDAEGALALLERHERYKLAAELAEIKELAPGIAVRLWFLAGDIQRAVRLARLRGAFAEAVVRLADGHPKEARDLRLVWATSLAEAGRYVDAVRTAAVDQELKQIVQPWIEVGLALGGTAEAELLVLRAELAAEAGDEDLWDETVVRVRRLLADAGVAPHVLHHLALTVLDAPPSKAMGLLCRWVSRRLLRDGARPRSWELLRRLCDRSPKGTEESVLAVEIARIPKPQPVEAGAGPVPDALVEIGAADRGNAAIYDVALLPAGRLLVALGEVGVRLLDGDGRCLAHFDEPAHRLVTSDSGARATALAWRSPEELLPSAPPPAALATSLSAPSTPGLWRLARLDLVTRSSAAWTEAHLQAFAGSDDGSTWLVAQEGVLLVIDLLEKEGLKSLWRLPNLPGQVHWIERDDRRCLMDVVSVEGDERARWSLELPSYVLRERTPFDEVPVDETAQQAEAVFQATFLHDGVEVGWRHQGAQILVWDEHGRIVVRHIESGEVREHRLRV